MKKHKLKLFGPIVALSATMIMVASCKKETIDIDPTKIIGVERHITTSAAMPQSTDKAYLDYADGRKVKWESADSLNINGTNLPLTRLNADLTKAWLEGTTYAIPSGGNDVYWAVYPPSIAGTASGSTIPRNFTASALTVNFPSTQTYNSSANALNGNTCMAAFASVPAGQTDLSFFMKNLGTVLKLNLKADASATNKKATKIEFTTTNGALAGAFSVNNGSTPTVTPTANVTKVLTVNLTDGNNNYIDLSTPKDIYVILPPLASKNLTMTIYNTQKKQTNKTMASATLERNKIYTNTISDITFNGPKGFSVAADRRVYLAPGNLQWSATGGGSTPTTHVVAGGGTEAGTFRFAPRQWDYLGNTAGNTTAEANRSTQSAWIDLFGWGTSGWNNGNYWYQPYNSSNSQEGRYTGTNGYGYGPTNGRSYEYDLTGTYANADWGVYNAICNLKTNTTDPPGSWRTLTISEWTYLLNTRRTVSGIRYAKAVVNNVKGMILVPDNWDASIYTLNSTNTSGAPFTANNISSNVWTSLFEASGCAFLPTPGFRYGIELHNVGSYGCYWSSTHKSYNGSNAWAYHFHFDKDQILLEGGESALSRAYGYSVRLAQDIE